MVIYHLVNKIAWTIIIIIFLSLSLLVLTSCSEEEYCANPYVERYDTYTDYDGLPIIVPVYECAD